jgi:hypothetical protein
MGILSDIFGKKETKPTINTPTLKEKYSPYCIETVNNRVYLEDFFDVNNNNLGQPLRIIPNCPQCCAEYSCAVGVHVRNYWRAIEDGYIKPIKTKTETPKVTVGEPKSGTDEPKSRFNDIV